MNLAHITAWAVVGFTMTHRLWVIVYESFDQTSHFIPVNTSCLILFFYFIPPTIFTPPSYISLHPGYHLISITSSFSKLLSILHWLCCIGVCKQQDPKKDQSRRSRSKADDPWVKSDDPSKSRRSFVKADDLLGSKQTIFGSKQTILSESRRSQGLKADDPIWNFYVWKQTIYEYKII